MKKSCLIVEYWRFLITGVEKAWSKWVYELFIFSNNHGFYRYAG